MDTYILDGHKPVKEPDIAKWGAWMQTASRRVRKSQVTIELMGKTVDVSTVFLGINHQYGNGPPILFETMVFGGPLDQEMERCSTWEEAEKMHEAMCERVKNMPPPE